MKRTYLANIMREIIPAPDSSILSLHPSSKFILALSLLVFSSQSVFAQTLKTPNSLHHSMTKYFWKDTITSNQIHYWPDGKVKVEYRRISKKAKIKSEYFKNGRLKSLYKVKQIYSSDTIARFVPRTYEETITIRSGYIDIPIGDYTEYYKTVNNIEKVKWKGQYKVIKITRHAYDFKRRKYVPRTFRQSQKVGKWKNYDIDGKVLHTVTYKWR